MSGTEPLWRQTALEFYEIGKAMADIERAMRLIRATSAVGDPLARIELDNGYNAARKLVKCFDTLRRQAAEGA